MGKIAFGIALTASIFALESAATQRVGINEPWATQFLQYSNVSCPDCPTNQEPRSLVEIQCRLHDLAYAQRVRVFREIIPFRLLQSVADFDDPENQRSRILMQQVIALYADYNVTVVLAFDRPLPEWMGAPSSWCPLPPLKDISDWAKLKNNTAWAIARFVAWLTTPTPAGGGIDPVWVQASLLLEPWNEFDAVAGPNCSFPSVTASPERSADLQGGVSYALLHTGFTTATMPVLVAPSVSGAQGSWTAFVAAYYASGGGGLPSIHWYGCNIEGLESVVAAVDAVLPAQYAGKQVLGETGCALATPQQCPSGPTAGSEAVRTAFFIALSNSTVLKSACRDVLFWRVMQLVDNKPPLGCEAAYGITASNDTAYDSAGSQFFQAIGGTGVSKACTKGAAT